MTSVVNLHAFANSPNLPLVVLVDKQQEHLAKPRLLAISEIGAALNNGRMVLDHSRRIGLPVAFVRMIGDPLSSIAPRRPSAGSKALSPTATKWCSNGQAGHAIVANRSPHR